VTEVLEIETPDGPARAHVHAVAHGSPRATLVLGHGIGRGVDAPDLVAVAAELPLDGIEVVLVEQPWHVREARIGGRPEVLDAAWLACLKDLRGRGIGVRRLVVGGRSAGARVACRTAEEVAPDALLLLAYPVHAIGRVVGPAEGKLPELLAAAAGRPTVVVQGTADRMGSHAEIAVALAEAEILARVVPVPWADHSFAVPRRAPISSQDALDLVVRAARATALRLITGY
jgi:uncharacterized protein